MKYGTLLAGAVLTVGALLPGLATRAVAAQAGEIVLAQDDRDHDKDRDKEHKPTDHMAKPEDHMGGHNAMMGHGHPNFDKHSFQRNFTAPHRFHVNVYERPHGWYYHRWVYGETLPAFFWAQNYWLNNYIDYGLTPPPPGFVWVRYGDDALLIDQSTGEVLQVEYGVFY